MQRNVLALKINKTSYIIPTFFECLLEHFQKNDNSVMVNCMLENGKLILEREKNGFELRVSEVSQNYSLCTISTTNHCTRCH